MANLFVSYDLRTPGRDYGSLTDGIKSYGKWAKVHKSFWFVKTDVAGSEVARDLWSKMDPSDTLIVVDTTNNTAYWYNLTDKVNAYILKNWGP